jgi:hypothetical protein
VYMINFLINKRFMSHITHLSHLGQYQKVSMLNFDPLLVDYNKLQFALCLLLWGDNVLSTEVNSCITCIPMFRHILGIDETKRFNCILTYRVYLHAAVYYIVVTVYYFVTTVYNIT